MYKNIKVYLHGTYAKQGSYIPSIYILYISQDIWAEFFAEDWMIHFMSNNTELPESKALLSLTITLVAHAQSQGVWMR